MDMEERWRMENEWMKNKCGSVDVDLVRTCLLHISYYYVDFINRYKSGTV